MLDAYGVLEDLAPERIAALPLLGSLLDLEIPDNDFTRTLEPKERYSALVVLLETCLLGAAQEQPVLLVLEDFHWIDAQSHDLLLALAQATAHAPVCIVLALRPPDQAQHAESGLDGLPHLSRILLGELTQEECAQAIRAKLAQLYPARAGSLPPALAAQLTARSQGNPFLLEELLNFLHDRGIDPYDETALARIALPESLHVLILSRIDQLSAREQTTLRVASIIGRRFHAAWLTGYYPALGDSGQVRADLDVLHTIEITPLDTPEPELAYLFKHIVTHEVAYESLPATTRVQLHERLGAFLEAAGASVELIAQHYLRTTNVAKQREYLRKAGDAARELYANEEALAQYAQLQPLLSAAAEQAELYLARGEILTTLGRYDEAAQLVHGALAVAEQSESAELRVRSQLACGELAFQRNEPQRAIEWFTTARSEAEALGAHELIAQAIFQLAWQAVDSVVDYTEAAALFEECLEMARMQSMPALEVRALSGLSTVVLFDDRARACALSDEALKKARELGNDALLGYALYVFAWHLYWLGKCATALVYQTEALARNDAIGDRYRQAKALYMIAYSYIGLGEAKQAHQAASRSSELSHLLRNDDVIWETDVILGEVLSSQGDYAAAQQLQESTLERARQMRRTGGGWEISWSLCYVGCMRLYAASDYQAATAYFSESSELASQAPLVSRFLQPMLTAQLSVVAALDNRYVESAQLHAQAQASLLQLAADPFYKADLLLTISLSAQLRNERAAAASHYIECLECLWDTEIRGHNLARALAGLSATTAANVATRERGALLAGFVQHRLKTMGTVLYPIERDLLDKALSEARQALGDIVVDRALAEGAALTLDAAVTLALAA